VGVGGRAGQTPGARGRRRPPRRRRGLSAGSLREPPRRISGGRTAQPHGAAQTSGCGGKRGARTGDAPWSGRAAPARSAPIRPPHPRCHRLPFAARSFIRSKHCAAGSASRQPTNRHGGMTGAAAQRQDEPEPGRRKCRPCWQAFDRRRRPARLQTFAVSRPLHVTGEGVWRETERPRQPKTPGIRDRALPVPLFPAGISRGPAETMRHHA
jgi:hypothetical protein